MPSTYAHYHFGEKVLSSLTGSLKEIIERNKQLYYIGLHGPDILFYYKPLGSNPVNSQGYSMHDKPASEFFLRADDVLRTAENREASIAYLAGFVCHFALDHACHSYIEKKIEVSHVAHAEIENEFDCFLIRNEGGEIRHTDITKHITSSEENTKVVAPFFVDISTKQAHKAIKSFKFYNGILVGNRWWKRFLVTFCLKVSGNYKKMKGVLYNNKPLEACEDSNKRLLKLLNKAVEDCIALENNFYGYINGQNDLDPTFDYTFGPYEGWNDIPVLDSQKEDEYEI